MRVDLALFDGDALLDRREIVVGDSEQVESFPLYQVMHKLGDEAADIVLYDFAERIDLKRSALRMPIHDSADWESIELGKYTLAFWCRLDS
jgi:hypothetical protein